MTKKVNVIDDYHGMKIYDPYRWLEDTTGDETQEFIDEHNEVTRKFIESYEDYDIIKDRMKELWKYETYSCPEKKGEYYYFFYNDGTMNQPCYYRAKELHGEKELLIDPNGISEDGTAAVTGVSVNAARNLLAYSISLGGSDWQTIRIYDMDEKRILDDEIKWCKFTGITWIGTSSSFIYSRYPRRGLMDDDELSYHNMVCAHKAGTSQDADIILIDGKRKSPYINDVQLTDDGRYMFIYKFEGTSKNNIVTVQDFGSNNTISPFENKEGSFEILGNEGTKFYVLTDYKAPKRRIISFDIESCSEDGWIEIMPEDDTDTISDALYNNGYIFASVMHHAHHNIKIYDIENCELYSHEMDKLGAISEISKGEDGKEAFFKFSSYFVPDTIYRFDFKENKYEKALEPHLDIDFSKYETTQVFVKSKDGTEIPMFISHRKGVKLDGGNRTLLYGYGGFNINRVPEFRIPELVWMERGGVFATANIRGGNEYGEAWHEDAVRDKKQNCFDDFIACGQWLIDNKYTNRKLLAIRGRSNGGLLTAACMVQRPDLFGAVITQVGVLDMLRYHKYTVGRFWIPEYGNAEESAEDFRFLYKYSPLHNIKCGTVYPPVLITTGDNDDRVLPCHSYKYAATLEEISSGENPVLLRVERNAGHGQGKPVSKLIDVEADIYAFLEKVLTL